MAKFRFRLETVVRLREQVRDERRLQLAEALEAEQKLRERMEEVEHEAAASKAAQRATAGLVDVDRLIHANRYELVLAVELRELATKREQVEQEVDRRREALAAADREVRVLEKLRETQRGRHRAHEEYRSIRELDEIAGLRAQRERDA
jgi:flagellar protein FliJ